MTQPIRHAFFVSDRTGITSEGLGDALLNQFEQFQFKRTTFPFVDSVEKAREVVRKINEVATQSENNPLVFSSIVDQTTRDLIKSSTATHFDFYDAFITNLENELQVKATQAVGRTHGISNTEAYDARMDAVNFTLNHDDGISSKELQLADVILVGVSRSGKTPTCLYLALQYGIRAANYPLTPDDLGLGSSELPKMLKPYRHKLFGLTIEPARLHHIRTERRPNSKYASIENCRSEINEAESMFRQHGIEFLSTTHKSVEELAASILQQTGLERRC